MNLIASLIAADDHDIDQARSISWLFPDSAELIYGTVASIIIFVALWKFAGPAIKKAMSDRTSRIQSELDESASANAEAQAEATQIRQAAGDIDAERQRLFTQADEQAEALVADGRLRLEEEVVELHTRADADIEASAGRASDEMRAEIARLANTATEQTLASGVIDDATQQELIEAFISKVGQS